MFSAETSLMKGKPEDIAIVDAIAVLPDPGGPSNRERHDWASAQRLGRGMRGSQSAYRGEVQRPKEFVQRF